MKTRCLVVLVASLLLVPFFLQDSVLGLDGYGRAFTIVALVGFLPMLTEGLAYSFTRGSICSQPIVQRGG